MWVLPTEVSRIMDGEKFMLFEPLAKVWVDERQSHFESIFEMK